MLETVEKIHDNLDDIWRQQEHAEYPQERMKHLLGIVTDDVLNGAQNSLSKYDLMKDSIAIVILHDIE